MGRTAERRRKHAEREARRAREERAAQQSNVNVVRFGCGIPIDDAHPVHDRECIVFAGKSLDQMRAEDIAERERDGRPAFGADRAEVRA